MYFTSAIALAVLGATAEAAKGRNTFAVLRFRGKALTYGRMDPIVNPGVPSGHVHAIQGGNAFALTMDENTPSKSTCTNAEVKNDFSNYWTPSLYFKDPKTGGIESVELSYQNVYYFFDAEKEAVHPFPKGLRMFVGNPSARTPPPTSQSIHDHSRGTIQPIQWTCPRDDQALRYPANSNGLDGAGIQDPTNKGSGVGFPDVNCPTMGSPLRADLTFPSCYDPSKGINNYKENMQYPTNGLCPQGTLHVPRLFFEVYWNTEAFKGRWNPDQGTSPWVLSNGDQTGYSLHGDFLNGWDTKTLQYVIDNCEAGSAGMVQCTDIPGGTTREGECKINNLVPETIFGKMDKLPGTNPILAWGAKVAPAPAPAAPAPLPVKVNNPAPTKAAPTVPTKAVTPAKAVDPVKPVANNPGSPVKPSTKKATQPTKQAVAPAPTARPVNANPPAGGSNTLVTSYVSETTVIWTTVTLPAPAPSSNAISNFAYKGCFSDQRFERALSGIEFANVGHQQVSNTKCIAHCSSRGFSLAGTEFGGQCFCGNELNGSKKIAESKCDMMCEGDKSQKCGGGLALTVFEKKAGKRTKRGMHLHRHQHVDGLSG